MIKSRISLPLVGAVVALAAVPGSALADGSAGGSSSLVVRKAGGQQVEYVRKAGGTGIEYMRKAGGDREAAIIAI